MVADTMRLREKMSESEVYAAVVRRAGMLQEGLWCILLPLFPPSPLPPPDNSRRGYFTQLLRYVPAMSLMFAFKEQFSLVRRSLQHMREKKRRRIHS